MFEIVIMLFTLAGVFALIQWWNGPDIPQ